MVGQTVSNYKILEKLGEGGMGVVFKAEDLSLRRIVALKFLSPQALGSPGERTRLLREAQAAAALDHPCICPVHGIHEHDGSVFLAMAYIDGPSLAEKIKQRPLPLDEALGVAIQIAQALQEAHQRGVVHRDIKPSNVMLTSKGQVKIMDFGLAQVAGHTRLTNGGREAAGVLSPDGAKIAYASTGSPGRIFEMRSDGAGEPVLLLEGSRLIPTGYSPDGRYLAYMTFEKGPPGVMILDRVEGKSVLMAEGGEAQFSPDGKWLAYTSTPGVFVQPFPDGGGRIQIVSNASQPRWSRDGKRLYFVAADRKLMEATIEVSGGTLTPSAPRALFQTHIVAPRFTLHQYDVTPDGSRFLINSLKPEAPLTLLANWPALLQR